MRNIVIYVILLIVSVAYLACAQNIVGNNLRLNPTSVPLTCNNGDIRIDQDDSNKAKKCQSNVWSSISGDVVGPNSSTDNAICRFDGVTGKLIQNGTPTISDTGSVSIPTSESSTSNPQVYLEQQSTGDSWLKLGLTSSTHYALGIDNSDSDKFKIGYASSGTISVDTDTRMTIDTSGRIGIGTTSPHSNLEIIGTDALAGLPITKPVLYTQGGAESSGTLGQPISLIAGDGTSSGGAFEVFAGSSEGTPGTLYLYAGSELSVTGSGANVEVSGGSGPSGYGYVLLNPSGGNVGIGTSVPQALLDVRGTVIFNEASSSTADVRMESDNNTHMFFLDADVDRIGIGTDAPQTALDVNGAQTIRGVAAPAVSPADRGRIYYDTATDTLKLSVNGGSYADILTSTTGNSSYVLKSGDTMTGRLAISAGGIDVTGASVLSSNVSIDPDAYSNRTVAGAIADGSPWSVTSAIGGNAGVGDSWAIGHNGSALYMAMGNGAANDTFQTYIYFSPNRNLSLVPDSGNVGIGANNGSPNTKLHVKSSSSASNINLLKLDNEGVGDGTAASMVFQLGGAEYAKVQGRYTSGAYLDFMSTGTTAHMTIDPSGDVGIGTTLPGALLDVRGSAIFNEDAADVDFRIEGDTVDNMFFVDASAATENIALVSLGTPNWQSMDRGLFIGQNSTVPSGSPTDGIFLWTADTVAGQTNLYSRNENGKVEQLTGLADRVSSQFDKTDVTLADITGLSHNVEAGKAYAFEAILYTTSNVSGGVKAAIAGTATATSIVYEGFTTDAGMSTQTRATALGSAVGDITAVTAAFIKINGTIVVANAGTLTVQFAENVAVGTSSVLVGSTFIVRPIGD